MNSQFLKLLMLTIMFICRPTECCLATTATTDRPNFLIVLADDCTFRDLGCYGGQAHTPHIDQLAKEGLRFTRCFQAAPMCSPTRHNLYTGVYPVKSGAYPNHTFVKPGVQSLPTMLKPAGYRVALSGKTHIGPKSAFPFEYLGKGKNPDMRAIDEYLQACQQQRTPFCLVACSNEPHTPWNKGDASRYPTETIRLPPYLVDTPYVRKQYGKYLAEITYYDQQVGQLLDLLDKWKFAENTVVIVLSEQGNSLPFAKWTCYGNGLQSAMIVRWPRRIAAATSTEAMVEYVDVVPTLLELARQPLPAQLEGRSFLPVLLGKTATHKEFVYGVMTTRGIINGSDLWASRTVRSPRYRLIWNLHHTSRFQNACTKSREYQSMVAKAESGDQQAQRLTRRYEYRPEFELYDCQSDPLELVNLAEDPAHAKIKTRLQGQLRIWMEAQGDMGHQTERQALLRQRRYQGQTLQQAEAEWEKQSAGKTK